MEGNIEKVKVLAEEPANIASRKSAPLLGSHRLNVFIMMMFGTTSYMLLRQNINFALVCMVKTPILNSTEDLSTAISFTNDTKKDIYDSAVDYRCELRAPSENGTAGLHDGEFDWSRETQANIRGSFYYGFIITQVLGGWMTDRFGGKLMILSTTLVFAILTILNPVAARLGPSYLFCVRLLQGFTHGPAFSCINMLAIRWSDPSERAFLVGIAYAGATLGATITYPVCAIICDTLGWDYIFYITGAIGILWCAVSSFIVFDWPESDPGISPNELLFLQQNRSKHLDINASGKKMQVPWTKIMTSLPVNTLNIVHFCTLWTFHTMSMYLPAFMDEVLRMDIRSNGVISSLPYFGMMIVHLSIGKIFDGIRSKNLCSITTLRKIFNTIGTVFPSLALIAVVLLSCNEYLLGMAAMSAGTAMAEFAFMGGYMLSIMELAPAYAGILSGVMNTFGVLPGFLCPVAVAYLAANGTREEWLNVFYLAAGVNMFGGLSYLLFGSGETQPWATVKSRPPPADLETGEKLLPVKSISNTTKADAE